MDNTVHIKETSTGPHGF